jgi:hypothetical protein
MLLCAHFLYAAEGGTVSVAESPTPFVNSDESYRGEFRYLCDVYDAIDLEGPAVKTDGWNNNIAEAEWPFMGMAYFGYACGHIAEYDDAMRREALARMRWLLEALQKPRMTGFTADHFGEPFLKETLPGASVFVHGHFLQLATRYRAVSRDMRFDDVMRRVAESLAKAFAQTGGDLLPSYPNMWWVSDNFPAVAALIRYDRLFGTNHSAFAGELIRRIKADYMDAGTGLIGTYVSPSKKQVLQGARGISVMYSLHFLKDIDAEFAESQWALAKKHLVRGGLGFAVVREFPPGVQGEADIDSGEVMLGIGPSASGFGVAAAAMMGDERVADQLMTSVLVVGAPQWRGDRLVYGSMPPVGQAVILFGKTGLRVGR